MVVGARVCVAMKVAMYTLAVFVTLLFVVMDPRVEAGTEIGRVAVILRVPNATTGVDDELDASRLTIRVSDTDPNWNGQIGNYYYILTSLPPQCPYEATAQAAAATDVFIYQLTTCQVDNAADVNTTVEIFIPGGSGRRLLWSGRGMPPSPIMRKLQTVSSVDIYTCAAAPVLDALSSVFGSSYDGCGAFNTPQTTDMINQLEAQKALFEQQSRINQNVSNLFGQQAVINSKQAAENFAINNSLVMLSIQTAALSMATAELTRHTDERFGNVSNDMRAIATTTANSVAALSQDSDARFALVGQRFINTSRDTTNTINFLISSLNEKQRITDGRIRQALEYTRKLETLFYNSAAGTNAYVNAVRLQQIWQAMADALSRNRVPVMDASVPGAAPIAADQLSDDDRTVVIDSIGISFVNLSIPSGGVTQLHQWSLNFYGNIAALKRLGIYTATYVDILKIVGGPGCTSGFAANESPVRACASWFDVTHKYCTRATGSTFAWTTTPTLLVASMCQGSIQTDTVWDGHRVDSVDTLHQLVGQMCNSRSLLAGTGFQVVSAIATAVVVVPANYSQGICSVDVQVLFEQEKIDTLSLPYVLYQRWIFGISMAVTKINLYSTKADGLPPRGLTVDQLPFHTLSNQRSYTCYATYLSTTQPDTVIVYRLKPLPVVTRVSIKVYDSPPDCTGSVCVPQGNLIRDLVPNTVSIEIPAPRFESGELLLGELTPTGLAEVFDPPRDIKSSAPFGSSQEGHATYIQWSLLSGYVVADTPLNPVAGSGVGEYDLKHWERDHPGTLYKHSAPVSPGYFRHPVTQGECDEVEGVPFNEVCNVLRDYKVDSHTSMRQGSLVVNPDQYAHEINFDAVIGPLILRVQSGCPEVNFDPDALDGRILTLTNSLPFTIKVLVARTNTDPTCPDQNPFTATMDTKSIQRIKFENCANYTAQVFRLSVDNALDPPVACGDPLTGTLQRASQQNLALADLINATSFAASTQLGTAVAADVLGLLDLFLSIITIAIPNVNVSVPGFDPAFASQANITSLVEALRARASGIDYTSNSAIDRVKPFLDVVDGIGVELDASNALVGSLAVDIKNRTDVFNASVLELQVTLAAFMEAHAAYVVVTDKLIADLRSGAAGGAGSKSCYNLNGINATLCFLIDFATTLMYFVVIGGLVYCGVKYCTPKPRVPGGGGGVGTAGRPGYSTPYDPYQRHLPVWSDHYTKQYSHATQY